jgi:DNA polymerase I-like protein with 3'-5' exonuclease and polymerase domains
MCKLYPQFNPLRELRNTLSKMRLNKLAVGSDGRNRTLLSPYRAVTSRSQPSSSKYIFGPDTVWRGFIKPPPGHGNAYIDYRSQEFGVGAALSGDQAMQADYNSKDVYLSFAKAVGLVPADATKVSHPEARELAKLVVLGIGYGMEAIALAFRINRHVLVARSLLRHYRERYWRYEEWANNRVRGAMLTGLTYTSFGWQYHITPNVNVRSVRNFPAQGNAAEILRLAICLGIENGIKICGPVHDAVLIEAPLDRLDEDIARMRGYMERASEIVLDGFKLGTDYVAVRYPDRYMDPRGRQFWDTIMSLL